MKVLPTAAEDLKLTHYIHINCSHIMKFWRPYNIYLEAKTFGIQSPECGGFCPAALALSTAKRRRVKTEGSLVAIKEYVTNLSSLQPPSESFIGSLP